MLNIDGLCFKAGDFSIRDISLSVSEGTCHVLLGGTGNGKTLLLEAIAGLRAIDGGSISIDNQIITNLPPEKRHISYVTQDLALFPHLSVKENVFYSHRIASGSLKNLIDVPELIDSLHLDGILNRSVQNLSGGELQRVAIARALASGNKVLLLDEPFSALHDSLKRSLWEMLSALKSRYSMSILMVTHDLDEAFYLSDFISIISQGSIIQTGTKESIINRPINPIAANMIGNFNFFSGSVSDLSQGSLAFFLPGVGIEIPITTPVFQAGANVTAAIRANSIIIGTVDHSDCIGVNCVLLKKTQCLYYQQFIVIPKSVINHTACRIVIEDSVDRWNSIREGDDVKVWFPVNAFHLFAN